MEAWMRGKLNRRVLLGAGIAALTSNGAPTVEAARKRGRPISLHPENPHYFRFRGRPTVLITSAEHYGAVLNPDFDFLPYLNELKARGFNLTRVFLGSYVEPPGAFNIRNNTLAPAPGRFLAPWARSGEPGYRGGGHKFDLTRWDDAYFRRLRQFVAAASERGIVVEAVPFCPMYEEMQWLLSPMNAVNNVNGIGSVPRTDVLARKDARLTEVQVALTRKIAAELREFDNVYFELCNEPYFGGVTLEWQHHIADTLVAAEADLPAESRHLIAQNIANGSKKVERPHPAVSVFNFHYAAPPRAVEENYGLQKVIAFDETGFKKTRDLPYRTEGWDFLLAGGAVYNHLDYSFTVNHPEGTEEVLEPTPGGGGPTLRGQLAILKRFIESFPFVEMAPDPAVVQGGVPAGATVRVLARKGRDYALYLKGGNAAGLLLDLPAGKYRAEWLNPRTGQIDRRETLDHRGGVVTLVSPPYVEDLALSVRRR